MSLESSSFDLERFKALLKTPLFAYDGLSECGILSYPEIHWFAEIKSTNQTLWDFAANGADEGTIALALKQTAGRGQWGRQWQSPPGGLYTSLLLKPNLMPEAAGQLTLCCAWGIAVALRHYNVPVFLKWFNDLVIEGRKLGGILAETKIQQGKIRQAVVGVGLNWSNPVPPMGINLQSVVIASSDGGTLDLEKVGAIVLQGVGFGYRYWQQNGIEAILPSYEDLLFNRGQAVMVAQQPGTVVGVSPTGQLRVHLPSHLEPDPIEVLLPPGSIHLGYPGTDRLPSTT